MTKTLLYTLVDNIATITFNRPDAMNSFNKEMAEELEVLTSHIKFDNGVHAVLLKGAGDLFMAGGDLRFFHEQLSTMPKGVMKIVRTLNASILNLVTMPKPVVASVHGSVAGVGMSLMLASDLVIAADGTKFTTAYTNIGITPDGGLTYHLPRLVGSKKAMEWLLFSSVFDANTAQSFGLVNWVVAPEILSEETHLVMKRLAAGPLESYAHTKRLINASWDHDLASQLELEAHAFEACSASNDFGIGVKAFLQKKKPTFGK